LGITGAAYAAPATYNVVADFSSASNPNGVWAYGYSSTLTNLDSNFALYTDASLSCWTGIECWNAPATGVPDIGRNTTGSLLNFATTVHVPVDQLHMHPYADTYSIVRWTAPGSGTYLFDGAWFVQDDHAESVTLDIVGLGYSSTFSNQLLGASKPFSELQYLAQGENIYFAVGPNGSYYYDSTGLTLTVAGVPEPGSLQLGLLGVLGLIGAGYFRARR
jgi:hypothetical protein